MLAFLFQGAAIIRYPEKAEKGDFEVHCTCAHWIIYPILCRILFMPETQILTFMLVSVVRPLVFMN